MNAVIASDAKQSRATHATLDCFGANAPRNDGAITGLVAETRQAAPTAVQASRRIRRRVLRMVLLAVFSQYVIIALAVGLPLAAVLHYEVAPRLIATFAAITTALNHSPY
jgi:hypothetical protein